MFCISQFCRICVKNDGTLVTLDKLDDDLISFYYKIKNCHPDMMKEETCIFTFICENCRYNLKKTYDFLNLCLNTEIILKNYITQLETSTYLNETPGKLADLLDNNYKELNCDILPIVQESDQKLFTDDMEIEIIKLEPICNESGTEGRRLDDDFSSFADRNLLICDNIETENLDTLNVQNRSENTTIMQVEQYTGSEDTIKVHRLRRRDGFARVYRRRCKECYKRLKMNEGKRVADSRTKKVMTYCETCEDNPTLCLDCFQDTHLFFV